MKRRRFIPVFGAAGSFFAAGGRASAVAQASAPLRATEGRRHPRIGCVSWNFHSLVPGAHPEEVVEFIGSLGFEGIELIANSRPDIDEYWTGATVDRIRKQLEKNRLAVSQFPFFQSVVKGSRAGIRTSEIAVLTTSNADVASPRILVRPWSISLRHGHASLLSQKSVI
jgi:hypothetical protein